MLQAWLRESKFVMVPAVVPPELVDHSVRWRPLIKHVLRIAKGVCCQGESTHCGCPGRIGELIEFPVSGPIELVDTAITASCRTESLVDDMVLALKYIGRRSKGPQRRSVDVGVVSYCPALFLILS